jgi:ADP-ribose pyrophosphatase YjhB (NUDIX family)
MNSKPFTAEEFKEIYSKVSRLCVDPIVRTPRGIILSLRTLPTYTNMWHLPGGTVLYREPVQDAIKRVYKEEVGAEVRIIRTLGYIEYPSELKERGFGHSVSIAVLCEMTGGILAGSTDSSMVEVFAELPDNVIPEQRAFLLKHWEEIFEA